MSKYMSVESKKYTMYKTKIYLFGLLISFFTIFLCVSLLHMYFIMYDSEVLLAVLSWYMLHNNAMYYLLVLLSAIIKE